MEWVKVESSMGRKEGNTMSEQKKESGGRVRNSFFAKEREVRREFTTNKVLILLIYKETFLSSEETKPSQFLA